MNSYSRKCRYCGVRIHLRKMPAGQWVAFEGFDTVHRCSFERKGSAENFAGRSREPYRKGQVGVDEFDLDDLEFADIAIPNHGVLSGGSTAPDIKRDLAEALREHRVVLLSYTARYRGRTQQTERAIEPLQMRGDFLDAYCRLRQDFRTFRISRIHRLTATSEGFSPRSMPSPGGRSVAPPQPASKNSGCIWAVIILAVLYMIAMLGG